MKLLHNKLENSLPNFELIEPVNALRFFERTFPEIRHDSYCE